MAKATKKVATAAIPASTTKNKSTKIKTPKAKKESTPLLQLASQFYALPLMRASCLDSSESFVKYLYVKARQVDDEATLIVSNVSVNDTPASLEELFNNLSPEHKVSSVEIGKDRLAVVKYQGVINLEETFLKTISREDCLVLGQQSIKPTSCVDKWIQEYKEQRPDRATIGREADEIVLELDRIERQREEQAREPQVDADGFTLVVSKKRKPLTSTTEPKPQSSAPTEPEKKKKRLMDENLSFYRFERRRLRKLEMEKLKTQMKGDMMRADRMKEEMARSNNA